ncbi:MAG: hypothetical protein WCG93_13025 [Paludibacter sp.]
MENEYVVIAIVLVCVFILLLYLVKRNQKDKDEVIRFLNETEIHDEPKSKENEN